MNFETSQPQTNDRPAPGVTDHVRGTALLMLVELHRNGGALIFQHDEQTRAAVQVLLTQRQIRAKVVCGCHLLRLAKGTCGGAR